MVIEIIVNYITEFVSAVGLAGVFILMALESTAAPVPSEAVMPFAGFLVAQGKMSLWSVVLFSTLGSIAGSLLSYYIGYFGGKPAVRKLGRFLFLNERHLERTEKFFGRHGGRTIFIARFIPIVRHLISIPAGIGRMEIKKFVILTALGAGAWNWFLTEVGIRLQENWEIILKYTQVIDVIIIALLVILAVWYFHNLKKR